jgi:hypothetical protein
MFERILLSTEEIGQRFVSRHIILDNEEGCWRIEQTCRAITQKARDEDDEALRAYDESHDL